VNRNELGFFGCRTPLAAGALALILGAGIAAKAGAGDDYPDLVCTDLDSLWVFLGDGQGGLQSPQQYYIADAVEPWSVAVGDLTGDGFPEIVSANRFGPHLSFFTNLGTGEFHPIPRILGTPERPYDVDLGDLDGDESLDIVITCNYDPGDVVFFFNDGEGGFLNQASLYPAPGGVCFNSVLADLDNSGSLDIVVVRNGTQALAPYLNRGDGGFDFKKAVAAGTDPKAIKACDFSGDGFADVAIANDTGGTITILLGDGLGGLVLKGSYTSGVQPRELVAVDLDDNGDKDIVVVGGRGSDYVSRFLGGGDGTFYGRVDFATGPRPNSVDAADFNLDGFADVAVANWSLDDASLATMTILYGDGSGGFPGKQDFVPQGGFRKIVALAAGQLNQSRFLRGDSTGDGQLNITDPIRTLRYLFIGDTMPCFDGADADDSGTLEISDSILPLRWLFMDGAPLAQPFPAAGFDPTPDRISCNP
jgi:hypothetical protein